MKDERSRLTSCDAKVLQQSLDFARHRAGLETERGKAAEIRASIAIAFLGILTVFTARLTDLIHELHNNAKLVVGAVLFFVLLFIAKGAYSALKVVSVSSRYRVEIDTVFDFQALSEIEALKEEVAATVWEAKQAVQTNTSKLFLLHRSQRNAFMAIVCMMVFGPLWLVSKENFFEFPLWTFAIVIAGGSALLASVDLAAERRGIWRKL
jgi:hypothetical protein